jgi:hypothetical protein
MSKQQSVAEVVDEIYESIRTTPKRQRRLLSKTFWPKFGFKNRTRDRVEVVKAALKERGLLINLDDAEFGTEGRDEWIILSLVEPAPPATTPLSFTNSVEVRTPSDEWFDLIRTREFESEREVEYYFIIPILEELDYTEPDFAIGYRVQMYEGVKKVNKEADFVIFDGKGREKDGALLIIEAKRAEVQITEDTVGQARAYALWLATPYYIATNGEEIRVYLFRGAIQPDVLLMNFKRGDFAEHWSKFYQTLSKNSVVEYKRKLIETLRGATG